MRENTTQGDEMSKKAITTILKEAYYNPGVSYFLGEWEIWCIHIYAVPGQNVRFAWSPCYYAKHPEHTFERNGERYPLQVESTTRSGLADTITRKNKQGATNVVSRGTLA